MLPETLTITLYNTSTRQGISLPSASTRQKTLVFVGNQNKTIDWHHLLGIATYSLRIPRTRYSEAYQTMLASERVLRRDWDLPEEDAAWANL
jgi:hypothetical protein